MLFASIGVPNCIIRQINHVEWVVRVPCEISIHIIIKFDSFDIEDAV